MMPPPVDAENADRINVAPAITNQVLISWLLATSPRSWASSRRFCVGSSVLSDASFSSAMVRLSPQRYQVVHDTDKIIEERSHHRRDDEGEDEEAGENRQRHADEIDLHLRHQPRQHAKPDIETQTEHQKRRGKLHADPESGGEGAGGECRDIAARHHLAGRKDGVAVVERGDDEM